MGQLIKSDFLTIYVASHEERGGRMGQSADHREQIYRQNEADTWGRGLTIESKFIGRTKPTHGAEG